MQLHGPLTETYADFADYAAGSSATFEAWAREVAADAEVQAWIARLPEPKRQPNLVFAAARWHGVAAPGPYGDLRAALLADDGRIEATIRSRATQTNEAARMATLLPAMALVAEDRPVALLEVGASAGLCLYPDRWSYRWRTGDDEVRLGDLPRTLSTAVTGAAPLPARLPRVIWRGGIDLHPLDVADDDAMLWLQTLVWPEHDDRRSRLREAIEVARSDPPALRSGDLLAHLPALVAERLAAFEEREDDPVLIVFHSAVLAYLDDAGRASYRRLMDAMLADPRVHWVSNEGRHVLADVTATAPEPPPAGRFVLGVDGRAVGHTEGHGRALHWW